MMLSIERSKYSQEKYFFKQLVPEVKNLLALRVRRRSTKEGSLSP